MKLSPKGRRGLVREKEGERQRNRLANLTLPSSPAPCVDQHDPNDHLRSPSSESTEGRSSSQSQAIRIANTGSRYRKLVLGECNYANKCVTCPMWLTSTDDLPALKSFYERSIRLKQRAQEVGNQVVVQQQTHIMTNLTVRLKSLQEPEGDGTLDLDSLLAQLRTDLVEAEAGQGAS